MTSEEERVLNLIATAFRHVTLGAGVGLRQGQGLDDYADSATLAAYRAQDEKVDWSAIPVDDLNRFSSSLSFFDREGMRFHLPAYLAADLNGILVTTDILFYLAYFDPGNLSRFDLLSDAQKNAVRQFLILRLSYTKYEFVRPMIEGALRVYWVADRESKD